MPDKKSTPTEPVSFTALEKVEVLPPPPTNFETVFEFLIGVVLGAAAGLALLVGLLPLMYLASASPSGTALFSLLCGTIVLIGGCFGSRD